MNYHELEIENTLRQAPRPAAPAGLKERLAAQVRLPSSHAAVQPSSLARPAGGWLRRWWPALAPATVSLACAVVLTMQQSEIRDIQASIDALRQGAGTGEAVAPATIDPTQNDASGVDAATRERQDIERLKQRASQLSSEIAQLEQIQAENQKLRAQLATPVVAGLPPEFQSDLAAMAQAKEKAQSIACVNYLKQVGLSFRVWAADNADNFPAVVPVSKGGAMLGGNSFNPVLVFQVMSNELSTPKLLVCPADTNRMVAPNFASLTSANISYQYVGANASETEPNVVLVLCPIHGNVLLCDGSVQREVYMTRPEQFVQRDGKLYFGEPQLPPPPSNRGRRGGPAQF